MRRLGVPVVFRGLVAALALGAWVGLAGPVQAHALLVSSNPAADTSVAVAPASITLTFTEPPDPRLSTVTVLDSSGSPHGPARPSPVVGQPDKLTIAPGPLPDGVYTVSWRTVSSIDGHLAAGSFAFSVGVAPPVAGSAATASSQVASQPLGVAIAHFVLYVGLLLLVGASLVAGFLAVELARPLLMLAGAAWLVAAVGTASLIAAQGLVAGVGPAELPGTSLGWAFVLRAAVVAGAGIGLLAARRAWASGSGARRAMRLTALVTAAGLLIDAALSHAGAGGPLEVAVQWLHLLAVGAWLGGLPALLLELGACTPGERGRVAWRFARLATLGIVLVAATGVLRAATEIGTLGNLVSTAFGQLLVVKAALLLVLAGLGAVNHFRHVPAATDTLTGLRRAARVEIGVALVVVLLSAQLGNLVPPVEAGPPAPASTALTADGQDFGTSVRLHLVVSPGTVGPDRFTASVTDYDSGAPLRASSVVLSFSLPARPDVGPSDLTLVPTADPGSYAASGSNLSLAGTWQVTALVAAGLDAVEVPLTLTVAEAPQVVDADRVPGAPTIYTVHLAAGDTVQVYLDPDKPGLPNDLHVTFFDAQGEGLAVTDISAAVAVGGGTPAPVPLQTLSPGHVAGRLSAPTGPQSITLVGTAPGGLALRARLTITPGG